jgi:hypothetical protein
VDHPSDCGISLDLRVPHSSHCCASVLEVSKAGQLGRGLATYCFHTSLSPKQFSLCHTGSPAHSLCFFSEFSQVS